MASKNRVQRSALSLVPVNPFAQTYDFVDVIEHLTKRVPMSRSKLLESVPPAIQAETHNIETMPSWMRAFSESAVTLQTIERTARLWYYCTVSGSKEDLFEFLKRSYQDVPEGRLRAISDKVHGELTGEFAAVAAPPLSLPEDGVIPKYRDYLAANPDAPRDPGQYYLDQWKKYEAVGLTQAELKRRDNSLSVAIRNQHGKMAAEYLPPSQRYLTRSKAEAGDPDAIIRQYKAKTQQSYRTKHRAPK